MSVRLLSAFLALAALAAAQGTTAAVEKAAKRFSDQAAKVPNASTRLEFQLTGMGTLLPKYPTLSREMLEPALAEIRSAKAPTLTIGAIRALASASPARDAIDALEWLPPGSAEALM